jgi:hypothetical protein
MSQEEVEELDQWEAANAGGYDRERWNELVELMPEEADTPVDQRWDALCLAFGDQPSYPAEPSPPPPHRHEWRPATWMEADGDTEGRYTCKGCGRVKLGEPGWAMSGESWWNAPSVLS